MWAAESQYNRELLRQTRKIKCCFLFGLLKSLICSACVDMLLKGPNLTRQTPVVWMSEWVSDWLTERDSFTQRKKRPEWGERWNHLRWGKARSEMRQDEKIAVQIEEEQDGDGKERKGQEKREKLNTFCSRLWFVCGESGQWPWFWWVGWDLIPFMQWWADRTLCSLQYCKLTSN